MTAASRDEHGFLRGFPYHDGLLQAVVLTEGRAMLEVRSTAGQCHVIELRGLTAFSAEGVREGNVVLNIRLLDPARIVGDTELTKLVRDRLHLESSALAEIQQLIFYLETSYGAEVLALCSEWSVLRGTFILSHA